MGDPKTIYVTSCADCPFQNEDSEGCNVADVAIAVWDAAAALQLPTNCPLHGGGVLVAIAAWAGKKEEP